MTKREKYFKDDIIPNQAYDLLFEFVGYMSLLDMSNQDNRIKTYDKVMEFLNQNVKPTLTEDEKVILNRIRNFYTHIKRTNAGLKITSGTLGAELGLPFNMFDDNLFQFIKQRRRI